MVPDWYVDWFDSPYYHLLYNKRDDAEASEFIRHLVTHLHLPGNAKVWDLACGRGRHSAALSKMGFCVTGSDLSENSIRFARRRKGEHLHFVVHDMREPFSEGPFDAVLNLFTSIGYFKDRTDNVRVFQNVAGALNDDGRFVVDFFNAAKVKAVDGTDATLVRGGVQFRTRKEVVDKRVVKHIEFEDNGEQFHFLESVAMLGLDDFLEFASKAGMKLVEKYGDYHLGSFMPESSDRLIMIFQKA